MRFFTPLFYVLHQQLTILYHPHSFLLKNDEIFYFSQPSVLI